MGNPVVGRERERKIEFYTKGINSVLKSRNVRDRERVRLRERSSEILPDANAK